MSAIEADLRRQLAELRDANRVLHRRAQHAEASRPATRSRGRAKLAADCVRLDARVSDLEVALGRIRALAAGWGHQPHVPGQLRDQALRDIEAEAVAALDPKGSIGEKPL